MTEPTEPRSKTSGSISVRLMFAWYDLWVPVSFTVERCDESPDLSDFLVTPGRVEWHTPPLTDLQSRTDDEFIEFGSSRPVPALAPGELR